MRSFLNENKYFLTLLIIFAISELIISPLGNFPLNDDWSYAKSVLIYHNEGKYEIGDFGAMTLFTHLVWGILFTKLFGFSFIVLRFSTIISSIIGLYFLNKLVVAISNNKALGFITCLVLLFNPMYFCLTNTYMTDVNFNTLLIIACYLAFIFFKSQKLHHAVLFFITCIALVLVRQFGIIIPLAFLFGCLFLKEKRFYSFGLALFGIFVVVLSLKIYENYLSEIVSVGSTYKFSGKIDLLTMGFWSSMFLNMKQRFNTSLLQIVFYSFPLAMLYLPSCLKNLKPKAILMITVITGILVYFLFVDEPFPYKNIFSNMCVGPETFYESTQTYIPHTYSESFTSIMRMCKFLFSFISIFVFLSVVLKLFLEKNVISVLNPKVIFLAVAFLAYLFMIFITESYFDRYSIPIITIGLIAFSFFNKKFEINLWLSLVPLILIFYISVAGTKDYFTLNEKKWEAFNYLKKEKNIDPNLINAGFEVNCWNEGQKTWFSYFISLEGYDYLIQFKSEHGFKLYKEYEFTRYFPHKTDKIYIFVRDIKQNKL